MSYLVLNCVAAILIYHKRLKNSMLLAILTYRWPLKTGIDVEIEFISDFNQAMTTSGVAAILIYHRKLNKSILFAIPAYWPHKETGIDVEMSFLNVILNELWQLPVS